MEVLNKRFVIVGVGPGSESYLTSAAQRAVKDACLLAGAQRLLDLFDDSPAERVVFNGSVDTWLDQIAQYVERNTNGSVALLVSGDPGVSSLAAQVLRRFGRRQCRVLAGISSVQLACAALGLSWDNAAIVVAHKRLPEKAPTQAGPRDPIVLLMGAKGAEQFAAVLARESGRFAYRCEDLSLPSERVALASAEELAQLTPHPRRIVVLTREQLDDL